MPVPMRPNSVRTSPRTRLLTAVAWTYTPEMKSRMKVWRVAGTARAQRSAGAPSRAAVKRVEVILRSSTSSTVPSSTTLPSK